MVNLKVLFNEAGYMFKHLLPSFDITNEVAVVLFLEAFFVKWSKCSVFVSRYSHSFTGKMVIIICLKKKMVVIPFTMSASCRKYLIFYCQYFLNEKYLIG